jgi:hypothetical protein
MRLSLKEVAVIVIVVVIVVIVGDIPCFGSDRRGDLYETRSQVTYVWYVETLYKNIIKVLKNQATQDWYIILGMDSEY